MNSMTENLVNSLTGNVPKAVLCVRNIKKLQQITENDGAAARLKKERSNMLSTYEQAAALQKSLMDRTQSALAGTLGAEERNQLMGADKEYLAMEVQYNPSSIQMQTTTGSQLDYCGGSMGNMANNMIVQNTVPTSTTMNVQLIFDDVNIFDSFMVNNVNSPVGSGVQAVKNLVQKEYSVQHQIEGILSLLTMDATRQVVFYWAKMCFRGELTAVQASYTMFNKSGNPVRGIVNLSIRQGEQGGVYDQDCWENAYANLFKKSKDGNSGGGASRFSQLTNNNILNLNL